MKVLLRKSPKKDKKWRVTFENGDRVDFGGKGYSDFTRHKDTQRMLRYLQRHRTRENWSVKGIKTAGFWSRWLLWSKPEFKDAKKLMYNKFKINIS